MKQFIFTQIDRVNAHKHSDLIWFAVWFTAYSILEILFPEAK